MQAVSNAMYMLFAIEILALPILFIVWIICKVQKKPKMKWIKWFWISFGVFLLAAVLTNPSTWCKHEYELTESKAASCTEDGYEKYHCDLCGGDKKETLKKLGHSMEDVRRVEPTDDKDGEYVQRCTRCGYEKIEVLPMLKKTTESKTEEKQEKARKAFEKSVEETEPKETKSTTAPTYSKNVESFAKKYKLPVETVQSLKDAMEQTDFPVAFDDLNGLEYTDDWAAGERYRVWHYDTKEDKYYTLLVYVSHGRVESLYDITDGRVLIYTAPSIPPETIDTDGGAIQLLDGLLGKYGKEVLVGGETYIWYMVPAGTYMVENQLKFATVFVVADGNSEDVRQTVQFSEAGQTGEITVEEGTHIELSMRTEVLFTLVGE